MQAVVFIFLFGLFVGSFLNMLIDRLPRAEQIWRGRSHCDQCKHVLRVVDLIPVMSWVVLRGKCRYCRSPIPLRNTLVELITGILFISSYHYSLYQYPMANYELRITNYELWISTFLNFSVISSLIVIFFVDLAHQIIPDETIVAGSIASLLLHVVNGDANIRMHANDTNNIISLLPIYLFTNLPIYLLSAFGAGAFFLLLYIATKGRGMGFGDVKLAFLMGLFLGFPKIVTSLYFAFLTGAFISVILIIRGKKRFGQTIAFGPFLVLGTLAAYFTNINLHAYVGF